MAVHRRLSSADRDRNGHGKAFTFQDMLDNSFYVKIPVQFRYKLYFLKTYIYMYVLQLSWYFVIY